MAYSLEPPRFFIPQNQGCPCRNSCLGNPRSNQIKDSDENSELQKQENDPVQPIEEKERVFSVGDKVHMSDCTGVVKFIGQLGGEGDEWVGIELDRQHPQGNDGRFQGVRLHM